MTENKKYMIRVSEQIVEVDYDVYRTYYAMERHARHLEEKDCMHGKVLYSNLDTADTIGEEMIPDRDAISTEDAAIANILHKQLHRCLEMLPESDYNLLQAIYFEGMSERQLSSKMGISQRTVNRRKRDALKRLRTFF